MLNLKISVCPFQSGEFDVILIDADTGEQVTLSGNQKLSDEELAIVTKLAPSCVWTTYQSSQGATNEQ